MESSAGDEASCASSVPEESLPSGREEAPPPEEPLSTRENEEPLAPEGPLPPHGEPPAQRASLPPGPVSSAARASTSSSEGGSVIDLPGNPVTAAAPGEDCPPGGEDAEPEEGALFIQEEEGMETETSQDEGEAPAAKGASGDHREDVFHGFTDLEAGEARSHRALKRRRFETEVSAEELFEVGAYYGAAIVPPGSKWHAARGGGGARGKASLASPPNRKGASAAAPAPPSAAGALPSPPANRRGSSNVVQLPRRESREWRPSGVLFKPLALGWVREVVYKQQADGTYDQGNPPTIVYHAPRRMPGTKPRQFRNIGELQSYLHSAEPTLSFHNFSFRREPMGAQPEQEVLRGENEKVEIFPPPPEKPSAPPPAQKTPKGGIKLKMFSKMNEKNSIGSSPPAAEEGSSLPQAAAPAGMANAGIPTLTVSKPKKGSWGGSRKRSLPAAKPGSATSATQPSGMSPTVSITPVRGAAVARPNAFSSGGAMTPWGDQPMHQGQQQQQRLGGTGKPVLRPATRPGSSPSSCNIHCPGVSGFPSLSCLSCHSMFHPPCMGLADGVDYEGRYDFYCGGCQPPPGKENLSGGPPPFSSASRVAHGVVGGARRGSGHSSSPSHGSPSMPGSGGGARNTADKFSLPKGLSILPSSASRMGGRSGGAGSKPSSPANYRQHNGLSGAGAAAATNGDMGRKGPLPSSSLAPNAGAPAPVEAQSVVNISGIKYLAVPHPAQSQQQRKGGAQLQRRPPLGGGAPPLEDTKAGKVLLRPAEEGSAMPSFEVEESADGKLVLVPLKKGAKGNPFANNQKPQPTPPTQKSQTSDASSSAPLGKFFHSNLSSSYGVMLHVFRYLPVPDRLRAASVCRLWRDLAHSPDLWASVSLKNVRVARWGDAAAFFNRVRAKRLDMRRMVQQQPQQQPDDSWQEASSALATLTTVARLEFPRASLPHVSSVVSAVPPGRIRELGANTLAPSKDVDLSALASLSSLQGSLAALRLRGASGRMRLNGGLAPLGGFKGTLNKLSLLGVDNLTAADLEVLSSLDGLESLELGDCSSSSSGVTTEEVLRCVVSLPKLSSLRLEKAKTLGAGLGELAALKGLEKLELVDVVLKEGFGEGLVELAALKRLLLIPQYKDEVATINAEIVDCVPSIPGLSLFFLGLTNEWLQSMSTLMAASAASGGGGGPKDSFPIMVGGTCEMYSLSKLFKTMSAVMPQSRVKILKMNQVATGKQFIDSLLK